jgi:hypothetical protein
MIMIFRVLCLAVEGCLFDLKEDCERIEVI